MPDDLDPETLALIDNIASMISMWNDKIPGQEKAKIRQLHGVTPDQLERRLVDKGVKPELAKEARALLPV